MEGLLACWLSSGAAHRFPFVGGRRPRQAAGSTARSTAKAGTGARLWLWCFTLCCILPVPNRRPTLPCSRVPCVASERASRLAWRLGRPCRSRRSPGSSSHAQEGNCASPSHKAIAEVMTSASRSWAVHRAEQRPGRRHRRCPRRVSRAQGHAVSRC